MPMYEFRCEECKHEFEELTALDAKAPPCPKCKSEKTRRILSAVASQVSGGKAGGASCSPRGGFS